VEKVYFVAFGEPMKEVFGPYPLGTAEDDPEVRATLDTAGYGGVYYCVQAPGAARALTLALNQHRGSRGEHAAPD
jgi:hypothetical protein